MSTIVLDFSFFHIIIYLTFNLNVKYQTKEDDFLGNKTVTKNLYKSVLIYTEV